MKRILCFGDSNTFGYRPDGRGRYEENIRWTGRLQNQLGEDYHIIEEGLCGRTTIFPDELRIGRRGLDIVGPIVESHNPIDLFVIMLGTNDCKTRNKASAGIIAKGLEQVIEQARRSASKEMKVLVISPILLGKGVGDEGFDPEFNEESEQVCIRLATEYEKIAKASGYDFLDAAKFAKASPLDREHLDELEHEKLAEAIYQKLLEII